MARACGVSFAPVHAVVLVSGLVFAFICSVSATSKPPPPPPSGGYAGFREQVTVQDAGRTVRATVITIKQDLHSKTIEDVLMFCRIASMQRLGVLSCMSPCRCTSTMATLVSVSAVILTGPAQPPTKLSWYPISILPACQIGGVTT